MLPPATRFRQNRPPSILKDATYEVALAIRLKNHAVGAVAGRASIMDKSVCPDPAVAVVIEILFQVLAAAAVAVA